MDFIYGIEVVLQVNFISLNLESLYSLSAQC